MGIFSIDEKYEIELPLERFAICMNIYCKICVKIKES